MDAKQETYMQVLNEIGQWTLSKMLAEEKIKQLSVLGLKLNDELSQTAKAEQAEKASSAITESK